MVSHNCCLPALSAMLMILSGAATAPAAHAQESRQHSDMLPMLEELVVTARKREETVFDVPLSVSALGASQLEARKIRGLTDLAVSLPNVALDEVGTAKGIANFSMRGLGGKQFHPVHRSHRRYLRGRRLSGDEQRRRFRYL